MKKRLLILISLILILCAALTSCSPRGTDLESVTITFVTNFDQLKIAPIVIDRVSEAYMPEDPVVAGYNFIGWFYDEECTQRFLESDGIVQNITLYAKWKRSSSFEKPDDPILVESGGFSYESVGGNYTIIGYHGTKKDLVIPASYNAKPVTRIKEFAFRNNPNIETVTITSVLEKIEVGAFENCKSLRKFTVVAGSDYYSSDELGILYNRDKNSIVHVGMAIPISILEIPKEIEIIQSGAFYGCPFAVSFKAGSAYKILKKGAFNGFKGTLSLGSDIARIEQGGLNNFFGTLNLDKSNISTITMGAFDGYSGNKVVLPNTVNKIEVKAFSNCKGIIDLSLANITEITESAFAEYHGEELIIPNHITSIGESAFTMSSAKIIFEQDSQITTIPRLAFGRFAGEVYLPKSVVELKEHSFWSLQGNAKVEFANKKEEMTFEANAIDFEDKRVSFGI